MADAAPSAAPTSFAPGDIPALTRSQKMFTLLGTLLGLLLAALDQTIVATAGPAIQRSLNIEPSLYVWLTTSYLVASTVLVPIYGKLSDRFGRKPILLCGVGIFLAGSFLCGVAQSTVQLILFRAVQGVGSASLFTTAFAVTADIFTPIERGKYQGLFGAVFGLSSVIGPFVGGFITDHFGWHWVFFVNLPIGAVALFFIIARMPMLKRSGAPAPIDLAGAMVLVASLVPLLLALSLGKSPGAVERTGYAWGSWQILGMFAAFAVGLVAFLFIERAAQDPILDLKMFQDRAFGLGNLAAFIVGGSFLGAIVFLPLFMVNVVGLSATSSGLTTTPLTLGMVGGNLVVGQLVSRLGRYKPILLISLCILIVAFGVMGYTLSPASTQAELTVKMVLVGMGLGPSIPLYTLAIQTAVPPQRIGVATSVATFSRQMGATVGLAVVGTIFASTLSGEIGERMSALASKLPPAMRAQLSSRAEAPSAGAGEGMPAGTGSFAGGNPAVAAAMKEAFTVSIEHVYRVSLAIVALGLLVTLLLPELPLRRTSGAPPPME